ncbi:hypothetical protein [Methylocystis heyeri]|uniref:Uncharacterized protein n=1 Tax=Methylocystis heyeri TaxID=391905 RepID=A0A6B8KGQ3_9HYPH|nr:hypothetical protein [Methylocystis heyeri]QGM46155.1 hypothetical protein H2LOC_010855 [Methylocystis heyeri]
MTQTDWSLEALPWIELNYFYSSTWDARVYMVEDEFFIVLWRGHNGTYLFNKYTRQPRPPLRAASRSASRAASRAVESIRDPLEIQARLFEAAERGAIKLDPEHYPER